MATSTVYTNSESRRAYLDVPTTVVPLSGTLNVTVHEANKLVHTVSSVFPEEGRGIYFNVPFSLCQSDRSLEVHWTFTYTEDGSQYEYNNWTSIDVVTPILPFADIRRIVGEVDDEEDLYTIERAVRYIIQAHTGQNFGKFVGKRYVTGSGEPHLRLPARLMELKAVNGNRLMNEALALRGGGWFLQHKGLGGPPSIRADYHGWHEEPWTGYSLRAPIVAPYSNAVGSFAEHAEYEIDGVWGWKSVPAPVQEAARLLVNDYACGDSNYRDRFLTSMTAADWRIQFHEGAFSNTGNVRANQLLAEYVLRRGWVIV